MLGCRHCQITRLRQNSHGPGNLLVVGRNGNAVGRYSTVGGSDNTEPQLKFDERAVMINQRRQTLEGRIAGDKVPKSFEHTVRNSEI